MSRRAILVNPVFPRYRFGNKARTAFLHRNVMSAATPDGSTATPPETAKPKVGALTMQIIIRRDLLDVEKWPVGPLIAQGSHAATAIMHLQRENPAMKDYTADWKHMRKVSHVMGCSGPVLDAAASYPTGHPSGEQPDQTVGRHA